MSGRIKRPCGQGHRLDSRIFLPPQGWKDYPWIAKNGEITKESRLVFRSVAQSGWDPKILDLSLILYLNVIYLFNSNQGQPTRRADASWMELSCQGITRRDFPNTHSHSWSYRAETRTFFSINTELPFICTFLIYSTFPTTESTQRSERLRMVTWTKILTRHDGGSNTDDVGNKYFKLK